MTENPYAPPEAVSERLPDAAREIRTVIRVFRWVGWVGTVSYLPMTIAMIGALIYSLVAESIASPLELAPPSFVCGGVLFISITYLRTARALENKDPLSRRAATLLCCVLMLGFPLFTVIGVICLQKLRRHYVVYIGEGE